MENASLEELRALIEEEIYLIPEDRAAILAEFESATMESSSKAVETAPSRMPVASSPEAAEENHAAPQPEPEIKPEELAPEPIPVRGNFSKGILILHEEPVLRSELMEMLVKMITACGHSMNEIGLVAAESLDGRSMEDFKSLNAHTILKFGRVNHPINAIPAKPYEVHALRETEYLFADSLTAISESVPLKKKLWASLQVLFNLS